MDKSNQSLRVRYEYEKDKDLRLQYAHGVWGGVNPQGEVELNFYTESDKLPLFSERVILPDGSFGHEVAPFDENLKVVTRHINSKIIFNYQTARAVLEWLEEKVAALEMEGDAHQSFIGDDSGMSQ